MKVCGYGTYRGEGGRDENKPQINLNAKWLAEAGFHVGDQIDIAVAENELVIRKLVTA
ncbi:MAG: SymE family type I addiction module toxin [Clostridia bacterium]|nr:SymE family type I addiction module toxin [Clostridia bacterium]